MDFATLGITLIILGLLLVTGSAILLCLLAAGRA